MSLRARDQHTGRKRLATSLQLTPVEDSNIQMNQGFRTADMSAESWKVAGDATMTALRNDNPESQPLLDCRPLKGAIRAGWPTPHGETPLERRQGTATQSAAASPIWIRKSGRTPCFKHGSQQRKESSATTSIPYSPCSKEGDSLDGKEILTNAVRAALGYISATRNLLHNDHDSLYAIVPVRKTQPGGSRGEEELDRALGNSSANGDRQPFAFGIRFAPFKGVAYGTCHEGPDDEI